MSTAATAPAPTDDKPKPDDKPKAPRDPFREVIETVVFVVVLVLLLKLFVTEAFVIPTGSMAETLYGYQKIITCAACGHEFPVNAHDEVEGNALGAHGRWTLTPDIAFRLQANHWNGTISPQLVVRRVFDAHDRCEELRAWLELSRPTRA